MGWVMGALCVGAPLLVLAAYLVTLGEIDEVLDDSLRQTALLLADRDLVGALPTQPAASTVPFGATESMLIALARRPDGGLLFSSQPNVTLRFDAKPGASVQQANGQRWHVFTVVQADRTVQVAQPTQARRETAAESASQLVVPLFGSIAVIGGLLMAALRRGMKPLGEVNTALGQRTENSLAPLPLQNMPLELMPLVATLNALLHRLGAALQAQRNFVADAAHELRSPVTALQLQLQLLQRATSPAERAVSTAELAAGIARMRHLIEQLLDLSRAVAEPGGGAPPKGEPVPLAEIAREVVSRFNAVAEERGIDLGAKLKSDPVVTGQRWQLEMLLSNLVDNALRHAPSGGVVDVVVDAVDGMPAVRVIDTGPGLPENERLRVFDRFYRSPQSSGQVAGSGLGLAIVRTLAEQHGAQVSLHTGANGRGLEARVVFSAPA